MKWLKWIALVIGGLAAVLIAAVGWLLSMRLVRHPLLSEIGKMWSAGLGLLGERRR